MAKDQQVLAIQKEIEESHRPGAADAGEKPGYHLHAGFYCHPGTGLIWYGIRHDSSAFAALAQGGTPDAVGLANGISEALINTALGISTSALAIVAYNYFTSKIDELTYSIDEAGFSIIQTFSAQHGATEHHNTTV